MKKNILIGIFLITIISVLSIGFLFYNKNNKVRIIDKDFTFEYGSEVKIEAKDVINANDKIMNSFTIDLSDIKEVGTYKKKFTYNGIFNVVEDSLLITIIDTTKPSFINSKTEFTIENGDKDYDFKSAFTCEDLSICEIQIDTSDVDFDKAGTYEAKAKAIDKYQNEEVLNFKINIKEAEKETETIKPQGIKPKYVNGILIVNKKYPIPAYFSSGEDKIAGDSVRRLIDDMRKLGYNISTYYSGYRSHDYQRTLYNNYVANDGKANADTYSARPGHSEHETGLTFDICHSDGTLVTAENEANWLSENAHKYGFIVRYKAGKEHITGFMAEPWHLRYIGEKARDIYESGLCLEEYLGVEGGDYNY